MASATDISLVRGRIGDSVKDASVTAIGDGQTKDFELKFNNVITISVYRDGTEVTAGDYTVSDSSGVVTFPFAPNQGALLQFDFTYAAFTDEELGTRIDNYGIDAAVVECLLELLADSARLYDYSNGDTDSKQSQVFKQLHTLLEFYQKRLDASTGFTDGNGDVIGSAVFGERYNELEGSQEERRRRDLSRDDRDVLY